MCVGDGEWGSGTPEEEEVQLGRRKRDSGRRPSPPLRAAPPLPSRRPTRGRRPCQGGPMIARLCLTTKTGLAEKVGTFAGKRGKVKARQWALSCVDPLGGSGNSRPETRACRASPLLLLCATRLCLPSPARRWQGAAMCEGYRAGLARGGRLGCERAGTGREGLTGVPRPASL
jgi:hypothetical protein